MVEQVIQAHQGLTAFLVHVDLSDSTRGRTLDTYFFLKSVDIRENKEIHADLGYTWLVTVRPTRVVLPDDLFALAVEGDNLRFGKIGTVQEVTDGGTVTATASPTQ